MSLFGDPVLISRRFWSFLRSVIESTALRLLDLLILKSVGHSDDLVLCDLEHRRRVAALSKFYKVCCVRGTKHK